MKTSPQPSVLNWRGRLVFIVIVVLGYAITFAFIAVQPGRLITNEEIFWGISFGVLFILIGLYEHVIYDLLPVGWAEALFFTLQCSLVFGHGMVLYIGGNFLMGAPLIWFAIERLKSRERFVVYIALVAAVVLPLGLRHETWITALINGVTGSVYVLFLALFINMRLKEQRAREHVESLMVELEDANLQLAAYATQAEELAMTQERNRLAREIHDNLGHYLTVVNVQIEAAKVMMDSEPKRAFDALNKAQELAQKGLTRVRESVAALRESPVSNRPISEAIASLVEETQSAGIVTEFKVTGEPQSLDNKSALALYRSAQEGLTNVRRHARASRVDVLLAFQHNEVCLKVKDNGVGVADTSGGFGLLGIRERMHLLGGRLEINTGLGKGFCLTVSVPITNSDKPVKPEE